MTLKDALHNRLHTYRTTYDLHELAFIFNRPEAEILTALKQLEAEGKAQHDGNDWRMNMPKQREQKELFV